MDFGRNSASFDFRVFQQNRPGAAVELNSPNATQHRDSGAIILLDEWPQSVSGGYLLPGGKRR
jgi:hypothetical protein